MAGAAAVQMAEGIPVLEATPALAPWELDLATLGELDIAPQKNAGRTPGKRR
jgi:hypothetical protein